MTKEEQYTITRNIKKMRELRGYKQKHMAEKMGIGQTTYSKIENGEITMSNDYLDKIAAILGTTVEAIKNVDLERMVFNFNHHNQQGNSFG